uniref:CCR4-NOT transcription complex subunit 9 n=1 Tax=Henneguya salminicola TaxID=69463 RepID=A0A6G3MG50_HENSL
MLNPTSSVLANENLELERLLFLLEMLPNPNTRHETLLELEKNKGNVKIAQLLWISFGCVASLIQELVMVYPYLNCAPLNPSLSTRIGCVLELIHVLASDVVTRSQFLKSNIIYLLFPLLNGDKNNKTCEYLRLSALGVICSLITAENNEITQYLLNTELFYLLIKIMETSSDLARTVSTYSFLRLITTEIGLSYLCRNSQRLSLTLIVLGKMVYSISLNPEKSHKKLLKHILRCYFRIMEDEKSGHSIVFKNIPNELSYKAFKDILAEDKNCLSMLNQLIEEAEKRSCKYIHEHHHYQYKIGGRLRYFQ